MRDLSDNHAPRFILALVMAAVCAASPAKTIKGELPDFTELVRQHSAAVVNIGTEQKRPHPRRDVPPGFEAPDAPEGSPLHEFFRRFFGEEGPDRPGGGLPHASLGSGFIISKDGYIITNYHVVRNAEKIIVRLSDRREYVAEVVGADARSDIAVLKVEAEGELPALKIGKSSELEVGEWVLAIGSPFGFDHSVTAGIVSAKGRSLPNENYVPFIQTDVAINPGNSGGPLFNLDGEVVGVNSQIYSRTGGFMGLSFAVPIDVVLNVYQQLREKGSVTRGWLGVLIQDVTRELAESFEMKKPHGALVSKVIPDSPAADAGLQTGDVIIRYADKDVDSSADLPPMVGASSVGDKIALRVIRAGRNEQLIVEIGELPTEDELRIAGTTQRKQSANKRLNISVRELTDEERQERDVGDHGVVVEDVGDGPARDAGIRDGDIILQVNSQEVASVARLQEIVDLLAPGDRVPILLQRQGGPIFMALKIPSDE